jgi:hypothetical protein
MGRISKSAMLLFYLLPFTFCIGKAQELFVYTEPASNMPARTLGIRASNWLMDERATDRINYHLIPELMWGVNKNLMVHVEGFFSNRNGGLSAEGVGLYAKYRFFTIDTVYRHFRMAAFGRVTTNNADIHQEEITINGHNSGYGLGLIATQLLHKQAISATLWWEHAMDNYGGNEYPAAQPRDAMNLALSTGRLFFPKHYTGYQNVNFNGMIEVLGQQLLGSDKHYVDLAPSLQFIFNSQTRVDVGYRFEILGNMERTAPNGLLLRVEHVLFDVLK